LSVTLVLLVFVTPDIASPSHQSAYVCYHALAYSPLMLPWHMPQDPPLNKHFPS